MSDQEQPDYGKGYYPIPRQLRIDLTGAGINVIKLVWFVADLTFGWDSSRWVALSYDEILHGRKKWSGERMEAGSGISNDANVRRAIRDALEAGYIETIEDRGLTYYAIHHRYWAKAGLQAKWILFKRIPWTAEKDPLIDDTPPAINKIAQPLEDNGSAITRRAGGYQEDSSQLSLGEQAVITRIAAKSTETAPQEARAEGKDTSLDTSEIETDIDTFAASPNGSPPMSISQKQKQEEQDAAAGVTTGNVTPLQAPERSKRNEPTQEEIEEAARRAAELAAKEAAIQHAQAEKEARQRRERAKSSLAYFTPLAAKARQKWERLKQDGAGSRIIDAAYDEMREYERGLEQAQRDLEG